MAATRVSTEVSEYLAEIGREGGKIGGKATTPRKIKAARENVAIARQTLKEQRIEMTMRDVLGSAWCPNQ